MPGILFDQNVPRTLKDLLTGHEVRTAADQGWEDVTNGELLTMAETAGYSAIITADQNIVHQQKMGDRQIGLVVLSTNHWPTVRGSAARILQAIERVAESKFEYVDCGLPPRRRRPTRTGRLE